MERIFEMSCISSSGFKSHLAHFPAQAQKSKIYLFPKNSLYFRKWNFLALILKNFLYFLERKLFLYFLKIDFPYIFLNETLHFSHQAQEIKEIHPRRMFYTSGNGNPEKIYYIFPKEQLSYISGNGKPEFFFFVLGKASPEKPSYISASNFPRLKNEKTSYNLKELPSLRLKKNYCLSYFL